MTFTTLTHLGVERPLADWLITNPVIDLSNQQGGVISFEMPMNAPSGFYQLQISEIP
jgi:hypothetical protein